MELLQNLADMDITFQALKVNEFRIETVIFLVLVRVDFLVLLYNGCLILIPVGD